MNLGLGNPAPKILSKLALIEAIMKPDPLNPDLKQRGRASVAFLAYLHAGSADVRAKAEADIDASIEDVDALPDNLDQRAEYISSRIKLSKAIRTRRLIGEWHARNHGRIATEAVEEVLPELEADLVALDKGGTTLKLDPDFEAPAYWQGVEFHRTEGGWDGHEYAGYIHGEIIHRRMVDAIFPGGIFKQRAAVAARAPKDHYDRILDMGCSTGHFTAALAEAYPNSEIFGVDLSQRTLEHCRRVGNAMNCSWSLHQARAEDTKFDDASFDLVTSYILLHEVPAKIVKAIFAEAFRLLKPGGDLLMSDVARYSDLNKLDVWRADQGARNGGEPHWRASASLDLGQVARDVGFVDVTAGGEGPFAYPHVVQGRKPE